MKGNRFSIKNVLPSLLPFGVMILVGVAVGWFSGALLDTMTNGNDKLFFVYLILLCLSLIFSIYTQIIIHECGHLIFGMMTGYRFVSFNVFGIIWTKGADGRLRRSRMQIAGAGGQCLMAPPDYHEGRYPFVLYNLGGVLANLITAMLFVLLAWAIPFAPVRILLATQIFVGIAYTLINGLPIPVPSIQNDGTNLLCIRRNEYARRAFWTQMKVASELAQGRRIKCMPDEWFRPYPETAMNNPIVTSVAVMNASRLMDKLDFEAAEAAIRALLSRKKGIVPLHRMMLTLDGAVCELIASRPADLTAMLDDPDNKKLMKAMPANPSVLRTQYAVALLKDCDHEKAAKALERFNDAVNHYPNPQEIEGEREIIHAVQSAASCHQK